MTTKDRRNRELAQREQLFISTARELIRRDGLMNLQMSRLAEECDYATGTLYQHFVSKEDLLVALMTDSLRLRAELFELAGRWQGPSRERMFAIAVADMIFVRRYPEHFRIEQFAHTEVVWGAASKERREEHFEAARPLCDTVLKIVRDAADAGDLDLKSQTAEEISLGLWALALGMHNLAHTEGLLELYGVSDPYALMGRHMHHILNGLGWKPLFDPTLPQALAQMIQHSKQKIFHDSASERHSALSSARSMNEAGT